MGKLQAEQLSRALLDLKAGRPVLVVADEGLQNEGVLVFAAERATPDLLSFTIRYSSGYICVAMTDVDADRLLLPAMVVTNRNPRRTSFAATVDASDVTATGISATDRARTIRLLAMPGSTADDFTRPGHVVPVRAHAGGVLSRAGNTEAAVDLAVLAGLRPVAGMAVLVSETSPARMAQGAELRAFADRHGLALIAITQVEAHRLRYETHVHRAASARLPIVAGNFIATGYRSDLDAREHIAFHFGALGDGQDVLVHAHVECLTGDIFGSLRCACKASLELALAAIVDEGRGILLYLRQHEGPEGLLAKLQSYEQQDRGTSDHSDKAERTAHISAQDCALAAGMLKDLGVRSVRLLTDDLTTEQGFNANGIPVIRQAGTASASPPSGITGPRTPAEQAG